MSDAGTGAPVFSLTRNDNPIGSVELREGADPAPELPQLNEVQHYGFRLSPREPDTEYLIKIGDFGLTGEGGRDGSSGSAWGSDVLWEDAQHFESARGRVRASLASRPSGSGQSWTPRASLDVYVLPTKLGELRYERMLQDLLSISAGLVLDLVSRMLRGVGYAQSLRAISHRSAQLELRALDKLWAELAGPLDEIHQAPALGLERRVELRRFTGAEPLDQLSARALLARGIDPRRRARSGSVSVPGPMLRETGDTAEHRTILAFLELLGIRAQECIVAARLQMQRIEADRPLRDAAHGPGPSLYASIDLPKLRRLEAGIRRGVALRRRIERVARSPLFRQVRPRFGSLETPVFEHVDPYHAIGKTMRQYLSSSLVTLEDGEDERIKATSRLYEHWVFLQLAEGFRSCGLVCDDIRGLIRQLARHRFTLDIDPGMALSFRVDERRSIRMRYEPWILPFAAARERSETLCHGSPGGAAWSPDVLIEFIDSRGATAETLYAVVVDAKYSTAILEHHWSRVSKYAEIRTTSTRRQVVRQVWIAYSAPGASIRCRDDAVTWTDAGPDRPRDETILGTLGLTPAPSDSPETENANELEQNPHGAPPLELCRQFALGLLRYTGFVSEEAPSGNPTNA